MDIQDTVVEGTQSEVVTDSSTVVPDSNTEPEIKADAPSGDSAESTPAEPAWAPNYKVKAYDQEFEIPEMYRSLMNKENEREVRRIFEKAYAVDVMSPKMEKLRSEYEQVQSKYSDVEPKYTTIQKNLDRLGKMVELGDFDSFFQAIQIPEGTLQKWMYNKLQANSLPPEQRELYNREIELRKRAYQAELEKDQLQEAHSQDQATLNQYQVEKRTQDLQLQLSKPDVKQVAQAFNSRMGEGAFEKEVIQRAQWVAKTEGKDLTAEEAVQAVLKLVGPVQGTMAEGSMQTQPGQTSKPPVIPHVEGRSTSPTKKVITDVKELKRMYQEKFAEQ